MRAFHPRALCLAVLALAALALEAQSSTPSLRQAFAPYFALGAAVQPVFLDSGNPRAELLAEQFGALVAENCMKPETLEAAEGVFRFKDADKIVAFAARNGMSVRGHTLVWHQQTPLWFFSDPDKPTQAASRDTLLAREKLYIQTVVGHFRGRIRAWDVVNEALNEDGSLRGPAEGSTWMGIAGPDYIDKAFVWAHEVDPDALLVINDYNLESSPAKLDGMCGLVKGLLARGIPVGAVGLQMHVSVYSPDVESVRRAIGRLSALGLKVQVTEMDMSIYRGSEAARPVTDEILADQASRYGELFTLFREEGRAGRLDMVMLWGLSDDQSWRNDFPVAGRADAPLLFDSNLRPKPAFQAVLDAAGTP
jgi:endo-1,4-beta-xylanase